MTQHREKLRTERSTIPPLLITSAVKVSAPFTKLKNQEIRRNELLRSIKEWYSLGVRELVVCDGTGFDFTAEITRMGFTDLRFECFSFYNADDVVKERGKGFGEGQIIEYALARSKLIGKSNSFMKCTGKLWCENFLSIFTGFNGDFAADICLPVKRRMLDTRFYISDKTFYEKNFMSAHEEVNDKKGVFLEHIFFAAAEKNMGLKFATREPVSISGMSGTSGKFYKAFPVRKALKSIWREWEINVSYKLLKR